jgi:hypothetical protein
MKTVKLDTQEAPNKWWAARDARMRNYANSTRYTEFQRIAAERMKLALELVYRAKGIYIAYGKKGISLKVDQPRVIDRHELALLEAGWDQAGFVKKVTAQGVTYRLNVA